MCRRGGGAGARPAQARSTRPSAGQRTYRERSRGPSAGRWTYPARLGEAARPASGPGPAGRAPPTLSAGPARRRVDAVVGLPHPKSTLLIVALRVWLVLRP